MMTSSSTAEGVILVLFNRCCELVGQRATADDVSVVSYLPAVLAGNISSFTISDILLSVGSFLRRMNTTDIPVFTAIAGDRWGLVSGLIRVLALDNASHVCDKHGVSGDAHDNADAYCDDTDIPWHGSDDNSARYDDVSDRNKRFNKSDIGSDRSISGFDN